MSGQTVRAMPKLYGYVLGGRPSLLKILGGVIQRCLDAATRTGKASPLGDLDEIRLTVDQLAEGLDDLPAVLPVHQRHEVNVGRARQRALWAGQAGRA